MAISSSPDQAMVTHPLDVARQAALIGAGSTIPGLLIGATYGTLRTKTPILFSLISGAQWFCIGTTFSGIRTSLLHSTTLQNWWRQTRGAPLLPLPEQGPSHEDRIRASTVAGAATGFSLGFLFRGPRNVIPGTIMFALFGFAGQHAYDFLDRKNSDAVKQEHAPRGRVGEEKDGLLQRIGRSKWSPVKTLSEEEYVEMMKEKVLKVNAEVALLKDRIEAIKKEREEMMAEKAKAEAQEKANEKK